LFLITLPFAKSAAAEATNAPMISDGEPSGVGVTAVLRASYSGSDVTPLPL
jgi:hypothetical protein